MSRRSFPLTNRHACGGDQTLLRLAAAGERVLGLSRRPCCVGRERRFETQAALPSGPMPGRLRGQVIAPIPLLRLHLWLPHGVSRKNVVAHVGFPSLWNMYPVGKETNDARRKEKTPQFAEQGQASLVRATPCRPLQPPLRHRLLSPAQPMNQADQREAGISAITAAAKGSLTTQPSIKLSPSSSVSRPHRVADQRRTTRSQNLLLPLLPLLRNSISTVASAAAEPDPSALPGRPVERMPRLAGPVCLWNNRPRTRIAMRIDQGHRRFTGAERKQIHAQSERPHRLCST